MNNEEKTKEVSDKQRLANIINPLKEGKFSRYLNPKVSQFLKDPAYLGQIILDSIDKLESSHLDAKERIMYINTLKGIYQAVHGQKNMNLNINADLGKVERKVKLYDVWNKMHPDDKRYPSEEIDLNAPTVDSHESVHEIYKNAFPEHFEPSPNTVKANWDYSNRHDKSFNSSEIIEPGRPGDEFDIEDDATDVTDDIIEVTQEEKEIIKRMYAK